jgi:tRNA G18 (ribose-2'-O)-methylase SpoU
MPLLRIDDVADARLADYRHVPDPVLLRQGEIFVAEGRLVVRALLASTRLATRSVLVTATALEALGADIEPRLADLPVYLVEQGVIERLTGFNIHRGCLAIGERPAPLFLDALAARARTLVILEGVGNADNVGGIFRNAAALGGDGVVLGPGCCDPLYRKAIRTSMGAALRLPFAPVPDWPDALSRLRALGFEIVALTPAPGGQPIRELAIACAGRHVAVLAGAEGEGLSATALDAADRQARIPMAEGTDSLNVATAVAIALHELRTYTSG